MMSKTGTWVGKSIAGKRFRVVEEIGEGGMATVYRAFDTLRQHEVVLKVPRPAYLEDRALLRRFSLELRSLSQLRHPHILPIHEMIVHDDAPVAVMPYLTGGTLRQRRSEFGKGTTLQDVLQCWLPAIADAIDYMHSQGYLHRDVKPTNILFDERGNAVLGDFGIVRALSEEAEADQEKLTGNGMVLGTPEYMAPELIVGAECDGRADQYSLAVTAYEMMCGRVPFTGVNPAAVLMNQTSNAPVPPSSLCPPCPPTASDLVLKALSKRPEDRFPDCRAFARALCRAIGFEAKTVPLARLAEAGGGNTVSTEARQVATDAKSAEERELQKMVDACRYDEALTFFKGIPVAAQTRSIRDLASMAARRVSLIRDVERTLSSTSPPRGTTLRAAQQSLLKLREETPDDPRVHQLIAVLEERAGVPLPEPGGQSSGRRIAMLVGPLAFVGLVVLLAVVGLWATWSHQAGVAGTPNDAEQTDAASVIEDNHTKIATTPRPPASDDAERTPQSMAVGEPTMERAAPEPSETPESSPGLQLAAIPPVEVKEGEAMQLEFRLANGEVISPGLEIVGVEGIPESAVLDNESRFLSWVPSERDGPGEFRMTIGLRVAGRPPTLDTQQVLVRVSEVNTPPTVPPIPELTRKAGDALAFNVDADDVDFPKNEVTYALSVPSPEGLEIDSKTGVIQWPRVPPGEHEVFVIVSDDGMPSAKTRVPLSVTVPMPDPPSTPQVTYPISHVVFTNSPFEFRKNRQCTWTAVDGAFEYRIETSLYTRDAVYRNSVTPWKPFLKRTTKETSLSWDASSGPGQRSVLDEAMAASELGTSRHRHAIIRWRISAVDEWGIASAPSQWRCLFLCPYVSRLPKSYQETAENNFRKAIEQRDGAEERAKKD